MLKPDAIEDNVTCIDWTKKSSEACSGLSILALSAPGRGKLVESANWLYGDPTSGLNKLCISWISRPVYQSRKGSKSIIKIGRPQGPIQLPPTNNPVKRAMVFQELLDQGVADSKAELGKLLGLSRSRVSIVLNLLSLDEDIKDYLLGLNESDPRLNVLNEKQLRPIAKMRRREQTEVFSQLVQMSPGCHDVGEVPITSLVDFYDYLNNLQAQSGNFRKDSSAEGSERIRPSER